MARWGRSCESGEECFSLGQELQPTLALRCWSLRCWSWVLITTCLPAASTQRHGGGNSTKCVIGPEAQHGLVNLARLGWSGRPELCVVPERRVVMLGLGRIYPDFVTDSSTQWTFKTVPRWCCAPKIIPESSQQHAVLQNKFVNR